MKVIQQKKINITPHKSIYRKMGRSSHGFNESIAELVDNSIDAMMPEQKTGKFPLIIEIFIDIRNNQIIVRDNAKGMNEKEAANAIILAESSKGQENLGEYGFGLKTAALSIGKTFYVITGLKGKEEGYHLEYDEDKWENNSDLSWDSFPFNEIEKPVDEHGTNIKIENLNIKLSGSRIVSLKKDLGRRYRAYIKKNIILQVNKKLCKPEKIKWSDGWPEEFEFNTKFGKIYGIIGLMKESSQKGLYGFDLFRNGRMIRTYEKFAIPQHPTVARILGEINLDFVPVTHEKNRFIEGSTEYEEVKKICKESELFKKIIKEARKKAATQDKITKVVEEKTDLWQDFFTKAFRDPELKMIINPNVKTKRKQDDVEEDKGIRGTDIRDNIEVEERHPQLEPDKGEQKEPESIRKRTPKKTHEVLRHTITLQGKTFKFKHKWINDTGLGRKTCKVDEKEGIVIFTNTAFPALSATSDQAFYAAFNIAEAIAEVCGKESDLSTDEINELKDLSLRKASEFKNQIDEEKSRKNKSEKRKKCEICGKEIDFKSPLTKYCVECSYKRTQENLKKNSFLNVMKE